MNIICRFLCRFAMFTTTEMTAMTRPALQIANLLQLKSRSWYANTLRRGPCSNLIVVIADIPIGFRVHAIEYRTEIWFIDMSQ